MCNVDRIRFISNLFKWYVQYTILIQRLLSTVHYDCTKIRMNDAGFSVASVNNVSRSYLSVSLPTCCFSYDNGDRIFISTIHLYGRSFILARCIGDTVSVGVIL